jgi:hypothetical protein
VLLELVDEGTLDKGEYEQTVIPTYYRTGEEFTRPLREEPRVGAFELESCSEAELSDPLWSEFQRTGDRRDYATNVSDFLRAFSESSLFGRVADVRSAEAAADSTAGLLLLSALAGGYLIVTGVVALVS